MRDKEYRYRIYRNEKSIMPFVSEEEAFDYLKKNALRHKKAEFRIEKTETLFDSSKHPKDRKLLKEFRGQQGDNSNRVSSDKADSDIGPD
jgi:hypothetical protein